jgi:hypothetical protein
MSKSWGIIAASGILLLGGLAFWDLSLRAVPLEGPERLTAAEANGVIGVGVGLTAPRPSDTPAVSSGEALKIGKLSETGAPPEGTEAKLARLNGKPRGFPRSPGLVWLVVKPQALARSLGPCSSVQFPDYANMNVREFASLPGVAVVVEAETGRVVGGFAGRCLPENRPEQPIFDVWLDGISINRSDRFGSDVDAN